MLKGLISHPNCTMTLFLITRKAIRYFKSWKTRDSSEEAAEGGKKHRTRSVELMEAMETRLSIKRVLVGDLKKGASFQVDLHISGSGHNTCLSYKRFLFWILSLHEYSCLCLLRDVSRGRWSIWVAWHVHEEDGALFTDGGTAAGLPCMG